jgi:histidinol-phosphate aminotransferase
LTSADIRFRSDFERVQTYRTVRTLEQLSDKYGIPVDQWVKLNQNENPYGPVPEAVEAMAGVALHRYPDSQVTRLRDELAGYCNVPFDSIVAGNGGDEVIDFIFRLFIDSDDEVITCPPTFGFYSVVSTLNRARLVAVPRDEDYAIDVAGVEDLVTPGTKLILLCNPNNPTGSLTPRADIERLLALGIPLLVDEAYMEFSGETAADLIDAYPHLMIVRTLSKWCGLAGLRIGYGIFSPEIARALHALKPAYTVSAASDAAGAASLRRREALLETVARLRAAVQTTESELRSLEFLKVTPSRANYVYCRMADGSNIDWLYEALLRRGILPRHFPKPSALRITAGTESENARLFEALNEIANHVSRETVGSTAGKE